MTGQRPRRGGSRGQQRRYEELSAAGEEAGHPVRDATQVEVEGLKRLVAELSLEVLVLKKAAIPEFD